MMLINPSKVITGALVNAIAAMGGQVSKAAASHDADEDLAIVRWFETFRPTAILPVDLLSSPAVMGSARGGAGQR